MSVLFQKTYILRILENMAYQILRKQKKALSLHKNLAAAWPTTTEQNKPKRYPQIALEALMDYEPYINEHPTVIIGDMNCYKGQSGETKEFSIQVIFDLMEEWGFKSAYHHKTGEALGKESLTTYHHLFKEESRFFLDYAFTNIPIKDFHLFEWDREISDHVGQLIEI